jgi:molybdenum cofactor biosynthesis enzyme MoaA
VSHYYIKLNPILLTGTGEPFVSVPIRDFLFNLDASLYPDLKLFLLTNGQLLIKNWDKMKAAQPAVKSIQVSIDAAGRETYEAIRLGG